LSPSIRDTWVDVKVKVLSEQGAEKPIALLHHLESHSWKWKGILLGLLLCILLLGIPQTIDAEHYVPYLGRYNVQDLRVSISNPLAYMSLVTHPRTVCEQDVAHLL
jgi:hypothetical protein